MWVCVHREGERNKGDKGQSHQLDKHAEVNYENP